MIEMETPADLESLLLWLGPDADTGAHRYLEFRQRLVALFRFRGCEDPETLADKTLDRTASAILRPGFYFKGNPMAYLRGVARNVYLESLRSLRTVSQEELPELGETAAGTPSETAAEESIFSCLDTCLARLPAERRSLLLRYYQGRTSEKIDRRQQLARERSIDMNALRIQVFRLRKVARQCVEDCMNSREMTKPT
jgi:DNA-directed RNA polymerase specialized sigma24 family protein